jgi:hypothetical protein
VSRVPEEEGCVDFKGRQASEGLSNTAVAGQSRHVGEIDSLTVGRILTDRYSTRLVRGRVGKWV